MSNNKGQFNSETAAIAGRKSSKKGSTHLVTKATKKAMTLFVEGNIPKLQKWIDEIAKEDPYKAALVLSKFMPYVLPQLAKIDSDHAADFKPLLVQINMNGQEEESDEMK